MPEDSAILKTTEEKIQDRQQSDFDRLWQQHRPRIRRLMARLSGSVDLADDLTQEVSMRAFQAFPLFEGRSSAFTWLYRIAVNVALRHRERNPFENAPLNASVTATLRADDSHSPEAAALRADSKSAVWAALEQLPEDLRTTLILHVFEALKYREIAEVLDIPIGTVKSRINNAMQRLREELKDYVL